MKPLITENPEGHSLIETQPESAPAVPEVGSASTTAAADNPDQNDNIILNEPPKISQAQARANVEIAHRRLSEARVAVRVLQQQQSDTKAALALAITAWSTASDPGTPEERRAREHRAYLASEQARKMAQAAAGITGPRMSTRNHQALDPMTGRIGHKGNSRGAYPKQFLGRSVNDPTMFRGAAAKKL